MLAWLAIAACRPQINRIHQNSIPSASTSYPAEHKPECLSDFTRYHTAEHKQGCLSSAQDAKSYEVSSPACKLSGVCLWRI